MLRPVPTHFGFGIDVLQRLEDKLRTAWALRSPQTFLRRACLSSNEDTIGFRTMKPVR